MARPTDDKKETTIILRVNLETKDALTKEACSQNMSLSEYLRKKLSGDVDNVIQNSEVSGMEKEMASMAKYFNITYSEMMQKIWNGLHDGFLTIDGDMVVGIPGLQLDELYDACHEAGVDPQRAINKFVKDMRKK